MASTSNIKFHLFLLLQYRIIMIEDREIQSIKFHIIEILIM